MLQQHHAADTAGGDVARQRLRRAVAGLRPGEAEDEEAADHLLEGGRAGGREARQQAGGAEAEDVAAGEGRRRRGGHWGSQERGLMPR